MNGGPGTRHIMEHDAASIETIHISVNSHENRTLYAMPIAYLAMRGKKSLTCPYESALAAGLARHPARDALDVDVILVRLPYRDPTLQQKGTNLVDDAGALSDKPLTHPVQRLKVELLGRHDK